MLLPIAAATVSVALYAATPALAAAVANFRDFAHDRQFVNEGPRVTRGLILDSADVETCLRGRLIA